MNPASAAPHRRLADRDRIERELGAGGMAAVYLAHDVRHHRKVALKVLRPELSAILGPMLFDRERRHHNGGDGRETKPAFALDALERFTDLVPDAEVDVELHERSTIETGIDEKPRAAFSGV